MAQPIPPQSAFDHGNILLYVTVIFSLAAFGLNFHFASLMAGLGVSSSVVGLIAAFGLIFGMSSRVASGLQVDGSKKKIGLIFNIALLAAGSLCQWGADSLWLAALGRTLVLIGYSGVSVLAMVIVEQQTPARQRPEALSIVSICWFLGIILASVLTAAVFEPSESLNSYRLLFLVAALCSGAAMFFAAMAKEPALLQEPSARPEARFAQLRQNLHGLWPVLAVAFGFGVNFAVSTVFLAGYTAAIGPGAFSTYFMAYCVSAVAIGVLVKSWISLVGSYRMVLIGMTTLAFGQLLFPLMQSSWSLLLPAFCIGLGRAFAYPALFSMANAWNARGLGGRHTALVLLTIDFGTFCATPLLGALIDHFGHAWMFQSTALLVIAATATFAAGARNLASPGQFSE